VFQDRSDTGTSAPTINQPANFHVADVQRPILWRLFRRAAVRIPQFDRRVDVKDVVLVAPGQQIGATDIPSQIDDQIAGSRMPRQLLGHSPGHDLFLDEVQPALEVSLKSTATIDHIQHRDPVTGDWQMFEHERERTPRHTSAPQHQNPTVKGNPSTHHATS
jgi:hypothetical protein